MSASPSVPKLALPTARAVARPKELEPVKCSRDRKQAVREQRPVSKPQGSLLLSSDAEGGGCLGAQRKD